MQLLAIHISFEKYVDLLPILTELFVFLQRITNIPSPNIVLTIFSSKLCILNFYFVFFGGPS